MILFIFQNIRHKHIRKERFSARENLSEFAFCETIVFRDHSSYLATKTFRKSRIRNNTRISSCNIVVLTFSTDVLKTIWIAYSKNMATLAATSLENLLSVYCRLASEESVYTKTLSFLELSYHSVYI